jgi:hypothetical protein
MILRLFPTLRRIAVTQFGNISTLFPATEMKKLPHSAGAKAQNSRQRMQKRNYQVGGRRKRSVHLAVQNPANPTTKPKSKRRKPYKLHDRTINALIRSINECADAPIEVHCGCAGINRDTYHQWRKTAEAEPKGEHARQMAKVDRALYAAWKRLHEAAVRHKPTEVLFRRHHEHYPSERQRLELTGAEGLPLIPTENTFAVVIELASPQSEDREFVIEHQGGPNDGKREIWQPNGQEPPPL